MDETFQREIAREILQRAPSVNDVWKLACSLLINVILQAYDGDMLEPKRGDLRWDLHVIDQLIRSANPHVTVEQYAHLVAPGLTLDDDGAVVTTDDHLGRRGD